MRILGFSKLPLLGYPVRESLSKGYFLEHSCDCSHSYYLKKVSSASLVE